MAPSWGLSDRWRQDVVVVGGTACPSDGDNLLLYQSVDIAVAIDRIVVKSNDRAAKLTRVVGQEVQSADTVVVQVQVFQT